MIHLLINRLVIFLDKLGDALGTVWGWLCGLALFTLNLFIGYELAIYLVILAVLADTFFGVWAQVKQGKFAMSELCRLGLFPKLTFCAVLMLVFILLEKIMGTDSHICVATACALIGVTELWSISGNVLIIQPDFVLLRLIRVWLVGEIAHKMEITPKEVQDIFEESDKKRAEKKAQITKTDNHETGKSN